MNPPKKILVIDDEEKVQDLMVDILKPRGYEIFSAGSGDVGLTMAKQIKPDLILLDIMMPVMDGFKVQELLIQDETTREIPIIFITAKTTLEDTMRALSLGAAGYVEKPFDIRRLVRKIESLLPRT